MNEIFVASVYMYVFYPVLSMHFSKVLETKIVVPLSIHSTIITDDLELSLQNKPAGPHSAIGRAPDS